MDTTHLAFTAEDLISHKLERSGFLVAKPKFDIEGADLLVFMAISKGVKFCRVQSKGRTIIKSKSSNVIIPKRYVYGAFILFLFIDDGNYLETNLFCFSVEDIIKSWKLKTFKNSEKDYFNLSFSKSTYKNSKSKNNLLKYLFSDAKIKNIQSIIKQSDINKEFGFLFDLIKNQNELIKLQEERNKLEKLLIEIRHENEIIKIKENEIRYLEDLYLIHKNNHDKK